MTDDRHYDLSITIVPGITGPRKLQLIANIDCPRRRNCLPAGVDRSPHNASAPKICRGQPRRENGLRPVRQHTRPFSRGCCPTVPCGTRAAADHFAPLPIFPRTCVCARVYVCVFFRFLFSVFFSHFFSCPFFFFLQSRVNQSRLAQLRGSGGYCSPFWEMTEPSSAKCPLRYARGTFNIN